MRQGTANTQFRVEPEISSLANLLPSQAWSRDMQNERPSAPCQRNRRQECFKELVTGSLDAPTRDGPIPT